MTALLPPPKIFSVDASKVALYLLNLRHPTMNGRAKAAFYVSKGFDSNKPQELAQALIAHGHGSPLVRTSNNGYVDLFTYEGPLVGPKGQIDRIRSVWKLQNASSPGELVTAYRY